MKKKKQKILLGALVAATGLMAMNLPTIGSINETKAEEVSSISSIGFTTNIVKNEIGETCNFSVLKNDYILSNMPTLRQDKQAREGYTYTTSTLTETTTSINNEYKSRVAGEYSGIAFSAGIENACSVMIEKAKTNLVSQYYSIEKASCLLYSKTLVAGNSLEFIDTYQNYLNDSFYSALNKLKTGTLSYEDFFDTCGTHLIVGVKYGGTFETIYGVYSDTIAFTETEKSEMDTKISAIKTGTAVGASMYLDLTSSGLVNNSNSSRISYFKAVGGNGQFVSNLNNGLNAVDSWINSVNEDNAVVIDYTDNGLLPIWDILPAEYQDLQTGMKNAFDEYVSNNQEHLQTKDSLLTENSFSLNIVVREGEKTFTDSDRWTNYHDVVDIKASLAIMLHPYVLLGIPI